MDGSSPGSNCPWKPGSTACSACWFANAGSQGTTVLFLFSVAMILTIFFRGGERLFFLGLFLANGSALIWIHHRFPAWVRPYATPEARLPDFLAGFAVSTLACVLMLWVLLESHNAERQRTELRGTGPNQRV